ncbi:hypothetical protein P7K49_018002 [Saguinus oedipus]|uniref:Uncharacterized protein n=1 Tax=Saguinus oedipus TaxID=9490 RepID=A0ABQ9V4G3_SAGOE|nr:hypothetical protein P7K49_018002 [Saguinus oedipus]
MIFDPTMSKKKKKKPFILDEEGDTQTQETQPSEIKEVQPEPTEDKDLEAAEENNEDETLEKEEALEDEDSKKDDGISFSNQTGPAWAGSERDYTYEELLNRVFNIMREKNQDMVAGKKRKCVMKLP